MACRRLIKRISEFINPCKFVTNKIIYVVLLVVFFFLAIGFSFLCSILEAVLLSITPTYIRQKEREGSAIAISLKAFKEDIDKPLSSILTLNTIAHTVGAIGVGAQAGNVFGEGGFHIFGIALSWEGIIAAVMTLCILILSEIIPKTIGANNWKSLAPFTVSTIKVLNFVLLPFVWMSSLITKRLKKEKGKSVFSRIDFLAITDVITNEGVIDAEDSEIIRNVLQWDEIPIRKIMTPRTMLYAAKADTKIKDFYKEKELTFSRIPIYDTDLDSINGYVLKDTILESIINGNGDSELSILKRKFSVFPENQFVDDAFNSMMDKKEHIGLVVDEFGGVEGIITLEDIMETIIGKEIVDEYDKVEDLRKAAESKGKERLK